MKKPKTRKTPGAPKKEYRYRAVGSPIPADIVGPELERIWAAHGQQLKPEDLIAVASNPASPLHPCFEWDDQAAGARFRLYQARVLIRNVQVIVAGREPQTLFVHVNVETAEHKRARHYQHVDVILDHPTEYLAGLEELRRKLTAITASFQQLERLAQTAEAPDGDLQKLSAICSALITAKTLTERLQ